MTGAQSEHDALKSESLTEEEALELATALKQKLSDGETAKFRSRIHKQNGCGIG